MKRNIFILLSICLICASCDGFFDLKRPQETAWTSTVTYEKGLNSIYSSLNWGNGSGGMYDGMYFYQYRQFLLAGMANYISGPNGIEYYNRQYDQQITRMSSIWSQYYSWVTMCNLALDLDRDNDGNPFNLDMTSSDYKDNYLRQVAEYHFLRGLAYWRLIKTFAPPYNHNGGNDTPIIPLKDKGSYSKEDIENEELGTVEQVYSLIISDLKFAEENLPVHFTLNSWNNVAGYECGRANKYTAASLLGKVYFLMGRYADAKAEFDKVISSGEYSLGQPKDPFIRYKCSDVCSESIWEFNVGNPDATDWAQKNFAYWGLVMGLRFRDSNGADLDKDETVMSGWNGYAIAYTALKEMGWMVDPMNGDYTITPEAEADLRYQQVYHMMLPYKEGVVRGTEEYLTTESVSAHKSCTTPHVYVDKFMRGEKPYGRWSKVPYIKLSDIYLLRAWINWHDGNSAAAASDLNVVWNRANPTNPDRYNSSNVNHQAIYQEYLREMMGEGWILDFMMGTQMDIPAGDNSNLTPIPAPYSSCYFKIPDSETSLNHKYQN